MTLEVKSVRFDSDLQLTVSQIKSEFEAKGNEIVKYISKIQ